MSINQIKKIAVLTSIGAIALPFMAFATAVPATGGDDNTGAVSNISASIVASPSTGGDSNNGAVSDTTVTPPATGGDDNNGAVSDTTVTPPPTGGDDNNGAVSGLSTPPTPTTPTTPSGTTGGSSGGSSFSSGGSSIVPLALAITPASATTSCPLITSYLKQGGNNDGAQVTKLQIFLKNSQNLDVDVNGIFDQKTDAAVRAFQTKYMSDVMGPWGASLASGFVYITTEKKINELACNSPLTLNASEMSIINSYKSSQSNGENSSTNPTVGTIDSSTGILNASATPFGPGIGANASTSANTASVVNASILQRIWNFIKGLFGH